MKTNAPVSSSSACSRALCAADDHWIKFTSGPFEVLTDAGPRAGRETMVRFEEFRHALGQSSANRTCKRRSPCASSSSRTPRAGPPPARSPKAATATPSCSTKKTSPVLARGLHASSRACFLESNTAQMPPAFEHGLIEFFSTFEVNGIRITVGAPPPHPDLDWARVHLLVTDPEYFGKLRVLLYNLRKGVDEDPAYRNAFGKSAAEMEAQAKQHFAGRNFQTTRSPAGPWPSAIFPSAQVSDTDVRLARADLLAGAQSAAEYEALLREH